MVVRIYYDGEARPNPGRMRGALVAIAGDRATVHELDLGQGGSEEAEWASLLAAVRLARKEGWREVEVMGDNQGVTDHANGLGSPKRPGILAAREELDRLAEGFDCLDILHAPRRLNLAGRYLESGDGAEFRMGLALLEGIDHDR